jgi:tRNA (cytidine32/uridine32-2'-O)-methyltransferase
MFLRIQAVDPRGPGRVALGRKFANFRLPKKLVRGEQLVPRRKLVPRETHIQQLPIRIVLLRPRSAENLGAAARALKNFGLDDWVWVDPVVREDELEPARRLAVHAGDVLDAARTVESLDTAVADCTWVVGTTSRHVPGLRRIDPRQACSQLVERAAAGGRVALVFGDEQSGMRNAELLRCNAVSAVPSDRRQPSLNLAQAVLLYSYELRTATLAAQSASASAPRAVAATDAELHALQDLLGDVLAHSGFLVQSERHALHDLIAPLARSELSRREVRLWLAALHTVRRSGAYPGRAMARQRLQPSSLADPIRYSHGYRVGNTVYLAGALGTEADGSMVADINVQTRRAFEKLATVMQEAGGSLADIVKTTVFITDMRFREGYGEVRAEFIKGDAPASTLVQVVALADPRALIEIEAIAVLE